MSFTSQMRRYLRFDPQHLMAQRALGLNQSGKVHAQPPGRCIHQPPIRSLGGFEGPLRGMGIRVYWV
jgi:hypothetical protein